MIGQPFPQSFFGGSAPGLMGIPMPQPSYAPTEPAPGAVPTAAPTTPFLWGAGGAQITPDQLSARQRMAAQLQEPDYSPVSSAWQGAARAAGNVLGALQTRKLDKQEQQMASTRQRLLDALTKGDQSATAAAIGSGDPTLAQFGMEAYKLAHRPPPAPNDTERDYTFMVNTLGKPAADAWLTNKGDPFVTTNLPGGGFYNGPQSGLVARLGGGDPVSPQGAVPTAPVGKLTPIGGGPTQPASGGFR